MKPLELKIVFYLALIRAIGIFAWNVVSWLVRLTLSIWLASSLNVPEMAPVSDPAV